MPRYDDRLKNVLALIESEEHSNPDIIFRHICDILLQEGVWMERQRRSELVRYLTDYYPQASQTAKMEIADITSRVSDAPVEITALIAADDDIIGNHLWDRVRLTADDWMLMLPRLSKTALGRLRARMNLAESTSISVDREWRKRTRESDLRIPSLNDTLNFLRSAHAEAPAPADLPEPDTVESGSDGGDVALADYTALSDLSPDDESAADDTSTLFVPHEDDQDTAEEADVITSDADEEDDPIDLTHVLDVIDTAEDEDEPIDLADASPVQGDDEEEGQEEVVLTDETEPLETDTTQIIDLATIRERAQEVIAEEELSDDTGEDGDDVLQDKPEVEDPKIQDILQRLRDFGTRSKAMADDADEQELEDEDTGAPEDSDPEDDSDDGQADHERQAGSAMLFAVEDAEPVDPDPAPIPIFEPLAPEQSDVEEQMEPSESPRERIRRRVSIASLSPVLGAHWVTDRFGSIAETGPSGSDMFGLPAHNLIGEILSSLFTMSGRRALDKALSTRRAFRDVKAVSLAQEDGWSLAGVPVFDDDSGIFLGFRGTARPDPEYADTERRKREEDAAPREEQDSVLDISGLAHELKTPLNAIRGFAEMIETQQLGETSAFARHRSQHIGQQAQRLSNVLDDLLLKDAAQKGDDGDYDVSPSPVLEILSESLRDFAGDNLMTERLSQIDPRLTTPLDGRLVTRMVHRLIYYAAQWTPRGRPVSLSVNLSAADGRTLDLAARLPEWRGDRSEHDLIQVSRGPRLPFGHELADTALEGRPLTAVQADLEAVDARMELAGAAGQSTALVLSIPAY